MLHRIRRARGPIEAPRPCFNSVGCRPRYHPLKENCYFFCSSVLDLSEQLLGGTQKLLAKQSKAGHAGHRIPLPFLLGDNVSEYKKLVEEAKKAYGTKWDDFKQRVSSIRVFWT